jgi:hypothetical protein
VRGESSPIDKPFLSPKEPAMTHITIRLISAAAAIATTLVLFSGVVSIAEPQRSVLIAKVQRSEEIQNAPVAVTVASNDVAKSGK